MISGRTLFTSILTIVISIAVTSFVVTQLMKSSTHLETKQTVYDQVINSGILRCGYFSESPFTIIDPNTGKKSGIAVELAEKISDELGLKLEWVSAENFGAITEDLRNSRYDAICASLFNLPRAGRIDYTTPYAYVPVFAYTQKGRTEFDGRFDQLDWSKISVAGIDGEGATTIARKKIPNAKFVVLPPSSQIAEMLTSVVDKKADIGFVMPTVFKSFDKNNPNTLQKIASDKPFYVFNIAFGVKPNEPAFKNMLDFMIRNMIENGTMQELFKKYDPDGLLYRAQSTATSSP